MKFLPGNTIRRTIWPAFGEVVVLDEGQLTEQRGEIEQEHSSRQGHEGAVDEDHKWLVIKLM